MKMQLCLAALLALSATTVAIAADPWADTIVNYTPGTELESVFGSNPTIFFDNDTAALGAPTRDSLAFGGYTVSPYSSPSDVSEVVSVGKGGSLTVSFDEPVTDDAGNPFGVDLLIFGNAFFLVTDNNFTDGTNSGGLASEGGIVSISQDGVTFVEVTGLDADGLFPTNGYADTTDFFPAGPGSVPADFTRPVDPALDLTGLGAAATILAYGGSGGGVGINIGDYGFTEISYVRVTNPSGSLTTPEIDGFADVRAVPEPSALVLLLLAAPFVTRRR